MASLSPIKIGVRYCGGCNPRYDRVAAVQRLQVAFPDVSFSTDISPGGMALLLVVCGCSARCVSLPDLSAEEIKTFWLTSEADFPLLCRTIASLHHSQG